MGNGKAVRALLAIVAVIAACLPQPSLAAEIPSAPARIATQMTINGRPFSFESRRCVNIPAMPGAVKARVKVSRQQGSDAGNAAACRAIRFFQDPACTGQTLDLLPIIGTQSVKYVPGVVTSALCLTETSPPATGTTAPSGNILESANSVSESARAMLESTLGVTDPGTGTAISGVSNASIDPSTSNNTAEGPAATDAAVPVVFTPGTFTNDVVNPTKSPQPSVNACDTYTTADTVPGY